MTCLQRCFEILYAKGCRTVAAPALATGYGRFVALRHCLEQGGEWNFERIDMVCERGTEDIEMGFNAQQLSRGECDDT